MPDRERQRLISAHQEWLGFVQPVGLVVAPPVMVDVQVVPDRNISGRWHEFRDLLEEDDKGVSTTWRAPDLRSVFTGFLEWEDGDLADAADHRDAFEVSLPELGVVLSPTWVVSANDDDCLMLVRVEEGGVDLDAPPAPPPDDGWNASRQARFERLLRETEVETGLLCTDDSVRLVHAPRGESSGHITFNFADMASPAGRPILAAFDMLLSQNALFFGDVQEHLPRLLRRSREAQAEVSTRLSRQVLAALYELSRGFVAADARNDGGRFTDLARRDPDHSYEGLIAALMRMVFVLYAEDRGLMPNHPVYQQHYALGGLFARLRADAASWPDTMDQRFGAWAQLLALFRLIHRGGVHADLSFVARRGDLFAPDRFPFLGSRPSGGDGGIPMISDAVVWQVLQNLMMLDGERLSYRTLDVEQIGSVYEAIMGFGVELTSGRSIGVRSQKRTGAAAVIDLDGLLALDGGKRAGALRAATDQKLVGKAAAALREASEPADIVAALDRKVDRAATPEIVPPDTPVLQPTGERRRSGSHYTPRTLTEPIVDEALRPIFDRLGPTPEPSQVLDLKILDPAMGSGAFLVEACRQVAGKLVDAWSAHGGPPPFPADEDELLHARRLVARNCLYGVDKNPMAVDLARLSLWLATLAKEHEFTFVDHALRHGNFLVSLTKEQIDAANWQSDGMEHMAVCLALDKAKLAEDERNRIRKAADSAGEKDLRPLLQGADRHLDDARLIGDAVVAAYFAGRKRKDRNQERLEVIDILGHEDNDRKAGLSAKIKDLRSGDNPIDPFHFEIELPEVFNRDNPGFDMIVGNPPFSGKNGIVDANRDGFIDWLQMIHEGSHGNADLAAHFFRRSFSLLREGGAMGLIASNTIRQGDTRSTGLHWIRKHGGEIYSARRRIKWPGEAAVVVSTVHISKGEAPRPRKLDGLEVDRLTAYLVPHGGDDDPVALASNAKKSFQGSIILGNGFTFDDTDTKDVASPLSEMERLIDKDSRNSERIFPYIGGDELNKNPTQSHHRYVIDFEDFPLRRDDLDGTWSDATPSQRRAWLAEGIVPLDYNGDVAADWLDLLQIVEEKVKHKRDKQNRKALRDRWWQYAEKRPGLYKTVRTLPRVLAISYVGDNMAFSFLPTEMVYAHTLAIFALPEFFSFAILQSRIHEVWARFFGSSLEDRFRYIPGNCFETYPFLGNPSFVDRLEEIGERYYQFRAELMAESDKGLTAIYNRFHDGDENSDEIVEFRRLHNEMDRAVLAAYGWDDIRPECVFELEWEDEDEGGSSRRSKPWRHRWPEEIRNEVLARLLALNAERARDEALAGGGAGRTARLTGGEGFADSDAQLALDPEETAYE